MMSSSPDIVEEVSTDTEIKVSPPNMFKVILHNDDVTPFDFVVEVLHIIFHLDIDSAFEITSQVHNNGSGIAGVYPREIAEEKVSETENAAVLSGYPLKVTCEEE